MAEFIKDQLIQMTEVLGSNLSQDSFRNAELGQQPLSLAGKQLKSLQIIILETAKAVSSANSTAAQTKITESIREMLFTMRLVSLICNFWTIVLSVLVIYKLADQIIKAKKNRDKKRKRLYFTSILFVSLILVLSILNQLCLQFPNYVGIFDLSMECYTLLSLIFFFWQWRESIALYIEKNFVQPLLSNQDKLLEKKLLQQHTHNHSVSNQQYAHEVAERARNSIKQNPNDNTSMEQVKSEFYTAVLSKVKDIKLLSSFKFSTVSFGDNLNKQERAQKVARLEKFLRFSTVIVFALEIIFTITDLIDSASERKEVKKGESTKQIQSELDNFGLDIVQIVLTLITIYLLYVYQKLTDKIAKRDDPFSNANVLGLIIFMVVIQKYIIESVLTSMLAEEEFFTQSLLVTFRQTFFAIEILFVQIPLRHNFSIEHVET
ncbi:UNKNOWN [Stylonychia lemnae]|uniref:Transmembrane protein n=1 Tax=Stylonychia lemnae TaxID=5949 RepID=A0A078B2N9_STYLE|nr:UNKNOWN [Stylonychia lemnae]|eukprot:CDW88744.1 UNKNOWN [Stylonychia lemnae]